MTADAWLPLFPLHCVLFPQGGLSLRVFETRYVDMVRDCMKRDTPFGVVLIKHGAEVGTAAEPEEVGTLAHIRSWDMPSLGMLMLTTEGGQRFRITGTRVLPDQHVEAQVTLLPPDPPASITPAYADVAETLKEAHTHADFAPNGPVHYDDAGWVANRWAELLPLPLDIKQHLLTVDDPLTRLDLLRQCLLQQGLLQQA